MSSGGITSSLNGNSTTTQSTGGVGGESSVVSASAADQFATLLAASGASGLQALSASHFGSHHPFGSNVAATNGQFAAAIAAAAAQGRYPGGVASLGATNASSLQQALMTNAALSGLVSPANAAMFAASAAAGAGLTGMVLSPVIHVSGLSTEVCVCCCESWSRPSPFFPKNVFQF